MNSIAAGNRFSIFSFSLQIGCRRQRDPVETEIRFRDRIVHRIARFAVVPSREATGDVAGADAELHHDRCIAGFRKREGLVDEFDHPRLVDPRIHEPDRAFHGEGVGALLDNGRAFTRNPHRGRSGRRPMTPTEATLDSASEATIGSDGRLPGDGAADRVVYRCGQQWHRQPLHWHRLRYGRRVRPSGPLNRRSGPSIRCETGAPWYPPTYEIPDCSKALVMARMPSPSKYSPSPRRSISTSRAKVRSISVPRLRTWMPLRQRSAAELLLRQTILPCLVTGQPCQG